MPHRWDHRWGILFSWLPDYAGGFANATPLVVQSTVATFGAKASTFTVTPHTLAATFTGTLTFTSVSAMFTSPFWLTGPPPPPPGVLATATPVVVHVTCVRSGAVARTF